MAKKKLNFTPLELASLCDGEGWTILENNNVAAFGEEWKLQHPCNIYRKKYRDEKDARLKLKYMYKFHDYLWPQYIPYKNNWQQDMFLAHCEGWEEVVVSSGGSGAKSFTSAQIVLMWWLANPRHRAAVISSTTLDSLKARIYGYVVKLLRDTAVPTVGKEVKGNNPKVVYAGQPDMLHSISAVAIHTGSDGEKELATYIGRHPEDGLMIVLDEATEISSGIVSAIPNLKRGTPFFQMLALGNAKSRNDLHGMLATPEDGWDSIECGKNKKWKTARTKSVCLHFHPKESPAIVIEDPERRKLLSRIFITDAEYKLKVAELGENTASFYRFILGWWPKDSIENTIASEKFLQEHEIGDAALWSGLTPLQVVAGLDVAFQYGGQGCVLRFAWIGHMMNSMMVLDFRGDEFLYRIDIRVDAVESPELQIATQVLDLLARHGCPLSALAIDATGGGRLMGELLRVRSGLSEMPMKITSAKINAAASAGLNEEHGHYTVSATELWYSMRQFIQAGQIRGLDERSVWQLTNRVVQMKAGKPLIESKQEYRSRMSAIKPGLAHSPDEADAACLALQSAIRRYGFRIGQTKEMVAGINMPLDAKMRAFNLANAMRVESEKKAARTSPRVKFSSSLEDSIVRRNVR